MRNACICSKEQLGFVATYFPEHYFTPIDILMWLYDMAEYRDACEEAKNQDIYSIPPGGRGAKPSGGKAQ